MIVVGLTGSIAMGKSTAAAMFRRYGVPVFDADRAVHDLLNYDRKAIESIEAEFPGVVEAGRVDRSLLAGKVFGNPAALTRLEALIHPLVYQQRAGFIGRHRRRRTRMIVLDIPLLFETGANRMCNVVVVVSAPPFLQVQRLLQRPGMDHARIRAILSRQLSDFEKRRRADVVIHSGQGRAVTFRAIRRLIDTCHQHEHYDLSATRRRRNPSHQSFG